MRVDITASKSAQGAKDYFDESLSQEDYYTKDREIKGTWHGKDAERLALGEFVTRDQFHALCDNRTPEGEKLTPVDNKKRRVGYDITFNVPKSVSLHYAATQDPRILEIVQESIRETMAEVEQDAMVRVRAGKDKSSRENRSTRNFAYAEFVHFTARPVEGVCDPHLHAHCYVFNSSYDEAEGKRKALETSRIHERLPYHEAACASRIAEKLGDRLDLDTVQTATGWEIAGYEEAPELVQKFSQRGEVVKKRAAELGITDPDAIARLAGKTREAKQGEQTVESQRQGWLDRMTPEERRMIEEISSGEQGDRESPPVTASGAVNYALGHHLERASVVTDAKLRATALLNGIGSTTVEEVNAEIESRKAAGEILEGTGNQAGRVTTAEILSEEERIVSWANDGKGQRDPLSNVRVAPIEHRRSQEQATAINEILASRDRLMLLNGKAGVGKSTALFDAVEMMQRSGHQVHSFAPTTKAVKAMQAEGLAEAQTVAHLLANEKLQAELAGQVLLIDEAGMVGTKQMRQVVEIADQHDARVILAGDIHQHSSVPRGDSMRLLEEHAGLHVSSLETIHRQQSESYREIVAAASRGETDQAFRQMDEQGFVHESDDHRQAAADAYLKTTVEDGRSAIVVAPTHAEGDQLNRLIRDGLKDAGAIAQEETNIDRLRSSGLTDADRGLARFYTPGQVVKSHASIPGFRTGRGYEVAEVEDGRVFVHGSKNDPLKELPLDQAEKFDLFDKDQLPVSAGDQIRITRNGKIRRLGQDLKLTNGSLHQVAALTDTGDLQLENGAILSGDFGHIQHAYASTSQASQGLTAEHVFACQSAGTAANNAKQFYVTVSRGRQSASIFTDDKERLQQEIERSTDRLTAFELLTEAPESTEAEFPPLAQHLETHARLTSEIYQDNAPAAVENYRELDGPGYA